MAHNGVGFDKNNLHIDIMRAKKYKYAQFFALFGDMKNNPEDTFEKQYTVFCREIVAKEKDIRFCRTAREAELAAEEGKVAAFLSVEGAELLDGSIEKLDFAYELGVRAVTLTWNYENTLSGSNAQNPELGLKPQGKKFVNRCQELGIIVDVSHLSEAGFWDVIEITKKPIIATHSNAKALWNHSRNITDRQFKAIAETGGVAGINLFSAFLGEEPDIDTVIAHIEHFLSLGGEKSVAIGSDFDGCNKLPRGVHGIEDMEKIFNAMLKKNYTEELVYDIFYNNLMEVVKNICDI